MTKFLTILLTLIIALLYYISFYNGDNVASLPLLKSKLTLDFDTLIKVTTVMVALIFLYFMNKNLRYIQGTAYAFIMVLTAMFSSVLIWLIVFNGISTPYIKWGIILCFAACTLFLFWPREDIRSVSKKISNL